MKNRVDKYFNKLTKSNKVHEALIYIETLDKSYSSINSYGGKDLDTPMLMASVTKLFTTACILILYNEGKLGLNDKISDYLDEDTLKGLHIYKDVDYSFDITINHLLHQTSGLPDFYLGGVNSIYKNVIDKDYSYTFSDELKVIKSLSPNFAPGSRNKSYYTDANFDLLGKIIENITNLSFKRACQKYICTPLNLKNTFIASYYDDIPHSYYRDKRINRSEFVRSSFAGGGGVTTARELMIFLQSFFSGELFDKFILNEIDSFNKLQLSFYPICYAGGYMRIDTSYILSKKILLLGHSGSTGSFAFYNPSTNLFFVGDVPQTCDPTLCIRFLLKCALSFDRKK